MTSNLWYLKLQTLPDSLSLIIHTCLSKLSSCNRIMQTVSVKDKMVSQSSGSKEAKIWLSTLAKTSLVAPCVEDCYCLPVSEGGFCVKNHW